MIHARCELWNLNSVETADIQSFKSILGLESVENGPQLREKRLNANR